MYHKILDLKSLPNEIWKDVVGFKGIYEVSNLGRVRSHKDKTTFTRIHNIRKWDQRVLKQKIPKQTKDCRVSLWKDGKIYYCLVHRLVGKAFIPNPENKRTINHKDGNRLNNVLYNIEWATYKENNNHAFDTGLMPTNKRMKITNKDTKEITIHRSMTKAGLYIGRNHGYLSLRIKKNKFENDKWKWEVLV
jgi:hypothetical protein